MAGKKPADAIITADFVVTMDETLGVIQNGAVAVRDGLIQDVGPHKKITSAFRPSAIYGGRFRTLIPGLINTHTHAAMTLLRGLADDMPLKSWLEEHIWPAENKWLGEEFVRDGVRLACLEMLLSGTVAFADMYFYDEVAGEAASEMGMRALLCSGIIDMPTKTTSGAEDCLKKAEHLIQRFKGDEMIRSAIGAHSAYSCSPETLTRSAELARENNVMLSIHLSETQWEVREIDKLYSKTPVRHLDSLGLLGDDLLAAHCVWLDPEDIELLSARGVKVSHCIESNLKLSSGIAPVPQMLKAGLSVSLGTDGAASNNDLDLFGEMHTAALVHKGVCGDPTCMDAYTVLKMATVEGAKAFGLKGTLSPGAPADMVVVSTDSPHMTPTYNICSHLVYSAKASDVETVMVGGKVVVEEGRLISADREDILDNAAKWAGRISGKS